MMYSRLGLDRFLRTLNHNHSARASNDDLLVFSEDELNKLAAGARVVCKESAEEFSYEDFEASFGRFVSHSIDPATTSVNVSFLLFLSLFHIGQKLVRP